MSELFKNIEIARTRKPAFDMECNNCGWCCLTEVCQLGEFYGGTSMIPCQFLTRKGQKWLCGLILDGTIKRKEISIGSGCDAMTQDERIAEHLKREAGH